MVKDNRTETEIDSETEAEPVKMLDLSDLSDQVVKQYLPMIQSIAASIAAGGRLPPGIVFNDLISFGYEGFLKAYSSFSNDKGAQFQTYAACRIRGEILDRLRKEWRYRNPVSYKTIQNKIKSKISEVVKEAMLEENVSEADIEEKKQRAADIVANSAVVYMLSLDTADIQSQLTGAADVADDMVGKIEFAKERQILWEEVSSLSEREKDFIHLFYEKEKSQKEIAQILTLSKSKVSRMHVKILNKLRAKLKKRISDK